MKLLLLCIFFISLAAEASSKTGSVSLEEDGRIKIQIGLSRSSSQGSFELGSILEKYGFLNEEGFVRTRNALTPLEIYNYLYENGKYVFTILLPADEGRFFVSMGENGFISIEGIGAQRLFEVVKKHARRTHLTHLEQYAWGKSYCDKTLTASAEYRCMIQL